MKEDVSMSHRELELDNIERKMGEKRLQIEKDRLQNILDITNVMILAIDADELVSLVNRRGCEILGYSEHEIIGKNWFDTFVPERNRNETRTVFEKLMAGEVKPYECSENSVLTKSGEERIIAWHNSLLKNNEDYIIGTLSSGEDITHRDASELALRESEKQYRNLVDNALVGIYKTNLKGDIIYANEALAKMLEFESPEEMMREKILTRFNNPEDRKALIENLGKTGKVEKFEVALLTKTGKTRHVILNAILEGGVLSGMILDITERKQVEYNLLLFRNLIDSANDAIFVIEQETGRLLDINNMVCLTLGYSREELLELKISDIEVVYPHDFYWHKYVDIIRDKGSMVMESTYRRKDGTTFPVEINIKYVSLDRKGYFVAVVRDIARRRHMEEQLLLIKQDWEDTFNSITDMITIHDKDYNIIRANRAAEKLLSLPNLEEVFNVKCFKHYHGTEAPPQGCASCDCLTSGNACSFEIFEPHLNMNIELSAIPRYDDKNNVIGLIHVARDITERKKIEDAVMKAKGEWIMTVDNAAEMIVLADGELNIVRCNKSFADFAQKPLKQIIGLKCIDFLPCDSEQLLRGEETKVEAYTKNGRWLYINIHPIIDAKGRLINSIIIVTDITALKETEQKLVESLHELEKREQSLVKSKASFLNMLEDISESYKELQHLFVGLVKVMVNALDAKSPWTKGHSEKVAQIAQEIARVMNFDDEELKKLELAGLLHDIGKIGTYDYLLDKPTRLTPDEFEIVKKHPVQGADMIKDIKQLREIVPIIRHHHENFNGTGYPDRFKGEEIPFYASILHVADSFESMTSDRPYRPAPGIEYALSELKKYSGIQFDPRVVSVFLDIIERQKILS